MCHAVMLAGMLGFLTLRHTLVMYLLSIALLHLVGYRKAECMLEVPEAVIMMCSTFRLLHNDLPCRQPAAYCIVCYMAGRQATCACSLSCCDDWID